MTLNVLFSARPERWDEYQGPLNHALQKAGLVVNLQPEMAPDLVDYIVFAPNGPITDFSQFPRLKATLSLWAGVESIVTNPTLKVPLARMVDSGLSEGMVEWVTGHVLRHHLGMDGQICGQDGNWLPVVPPLARNRSVGLLGLGQLGTACARALAGLNFPVMAWSRRPQTLAGIDTHNGSAGLAQVLAQSEILILLLPLTDGTENILNAENLSLMPKGAFVINPGRGQLIDDAALIAALDTGQIAHATLDVFRQEPLPADHPYWPHPSVTVTPHIASETRPDTASEAIAENIRRCETGEKMKFLVDRTTGY
ncbi:MAG: glyoxylate/hydroxypyruvate reductase A [Marinosulfonomonas sp.]|nr:glyoxylate/hydroxypyruvate reductase A [Marinosulfonomonas sp.]